MPRQRRRGPGAPAPTGRPAVSVAALAPGHLRAALALLDEAFGSGYLTPTDADSYIGATRRAAWGAWDGRGRRLVGVVLAEWASWPPDGLRIPLPGAGAAHGAERSVGLLKAIAVRPECQRQGIGGRLARAAIAWLDRQPLAHHIAWAWQKPDGCPAAPLLERLGFRAIAVLPEFWRDDSLRRGYACPVCGSPCRCAAVLYHRRPTMPASLDAGATTR